MPCVPGADAAGPAPSDERLAALTLDVLRECVPAEVPGVVLLSGGLSERRATEVLQAISAERARRARACAPSRSPYPWAISFSFGRALQASAMRLWSAGRKQRGRGGGGGEGEGEGAREGAEGAERASVAAARTAAAALAGANRDASLGVYRGPHPAADADAADGVGLREGFRGFRDDAVAREAAAAAAGARREKEGEAAASAV
jgi:fructose-bisphosphate aldolase, class I